MAEPHMIGNWCCGTSQRFGTRFASCGSNSIEYRPDGYLRTRGFVPLLVVLWVLGDASERIREAVLAHDFSKGGSRD